MKAFSEIERLGREILDEVAHGEPADTFKITLIICIAHEQQHKVMGGRVMATYRIGDLLNIASQTSRLSVKTITGKSRYELHKNVRFAVAMIARDFGHSYSQIGRRLGGRDHTTIINAVKKAKIYYERCDEFAKLVDTIRAKADEIDPFEKLKPVKVDFVAPPALRRTGNQLCSTSSK